MRHLFAILLFFTLTQSNLFAQKNDYVWLFGYYGQNPHPDLGITYLDFNQFPVEVYNGDGLLSYNLTSASISNENAELLFYTNGIQVATPLHELMENGDSLNPGPIADAFYDEGYILNQGALILPRPESDSLYLLFHAKREPSSAGPPLVPTLYYSEIDISQNGGLGKVIRKNQVLVSDTLDGGKIKATKYANGRDWWVLMPRYDLYSYYTLLLTPDSLYNIGIQEVPPLDGYDSPSAGAAAFSSDGSKYATHNIRAFPNGHFVRLYDFDRCTGTLSNMRHISLTDTAGIGSVEFSPDSRFMYVPSEELIYKFDLTAPDVEATKTVVAVADGYQDTLSNGQLWLPTSFRNCQLGPDGRIYVGVAGSHKHLHVIQYPNKPGLACEVRQHSIHLPTWNFRSMPNFPNYRLGPLDGSPCDTLGLDNHPLAGFRWEADTLNPLLVEFTDNSFYEPTGWSWDFGDGAGSAEVNPLHEYSGPGTYTVCLTVSNQYDSDTFCREVAVVATEAEEALQGIGFELFPNPAYSSIHIVAHLLIGTNGPVRLTAFNILGQPLWQETLPAAGGEIQTSVDVSTWPPGVYFISLEAGGQTWVEKVVVR